MIILPHAVLVDEFCYKETEQVRLFKFQHFFNFSKLFS